MIHQNLPTSFLFTLIILAGCSTPVEIQKDDSVDFSKYNTYMWVNTQESENDTTNAYKFADIPIRNATNKRLNSLGWKQVETNPDLLVTYDILVENNAATTTSPVYSQPFTRMYYNPYIRRWRTLYYPSRLIGYQTYEQPVSEGTITISIVDAKNDRTIWQGWTKEEMNSSRPSPGNITSVVNRIFNKANLSK